MEEIFGECEGEEGMNTMGGIKRRLDIDRWKCTIFQSKHNTFRFLIPAMVVYLDRQVVVYRVDHRRNREMMIPPYLVS